MIWLIDITSHLFATPGDLFGIYQCMFAQHIIPYLKTPVFSWMSRYDGAQMTSFNCLQPSNDTEVCIVG